MDRINSEKHCRFSIAKEKKWQTKRHNVRNFLKIKNVEANQYNHELGTRLNIYKCVGNHKVTIPRNAANS